MCKSGINRNVFLEDKCCMPRYRLMISKARDPFVDQFVDRIDSILVSTNLISN